MTLGEFLAQAYGWDHPPVVSAGPRGAMGRIFRVEAGGAVYALKESFFEAPTEDRVEAEVALIRRSGVRAPLPHRDRHGHFLVAGPDGDRLRLYDWVDLQRLDPQAPDTPRLVGELLARLHTAAPATPLEVGGAAPDSWYHRPPDPAAFERALAGGADWVPRLAERVATLPELLDMVEPVDEGRLRLCHRDLHPDNVWAEPAGAAVVIDWDNLGPADPSREVAEALFDWWCDPSPDTAAMRAMYEAYRTGGGPGQVTGPADFAMLVCVRLNFLLVQLDAAMDPAVDAEHQSWAAHEIDESLRILPRPAELREVADLLSD